MSKLEPKWASQKFVVVEPKSETTGNFNVESGKVHVVGDGQGAVLATLPAAAAGLNVFVKALVTDIQTNTVSLVPQGGALIDGVAGNYSMEAEKQTLHLVADATNWFIL